AWTTLLRARFKRGGRHGGAMDSVSPRLCTDVEHGIADPFSAGAEHAIPPHETHRHRVHERVACVFGCETNFAPEIGNAKAVAVPADPRDHAFDEPPRARIIGLGEPERVEDGDRTRPHREDVAQDPANSGGSALERLDERRMVVALDLEDEGEIVTDVDDTGVLPGALEDMHGVGGERPEEDPRVLVRAVLGPER